MARNYEKNFGRLNRLWLQNGEVKKERRPKLSSLKSAEEISSWLPSIKNELDFLLKQTEVPCYTEHKIEEYRKRIMFVEAEYKAFVRKFHQLNSKLKRTPWTARPYERKMKGDTDPLTLHPWDAGRSISNLRPLQTPVLMLDELYSEFPGETSTHKYQEIRKNTNSTGYSNRVAELSSSKHSSKVNEDNSRIEVNESDTTLDSGILEVQTTPANVNVLGLDYSSSSEEDT